MKVLCKKAADGDLWDLSCALMDGLLDYQAHSSNGACVVLNSLLKQRGPVMQNRVGGGWERVGVWVAIVTECGNIRYLQGEGGFIIA